jgi:hypothetical protein
MLKKYTMKAISVLMAILMVLSVGTVAFAEPDDLADMEIVYRYNIIGSTSTVLNISGVAAQCGASLSAQYSTSLNIKMELQKYNGNAYSTVQTWTASRTGTLLNLSKSKTINPSNSYRLKVTFTAGSETVVRYGY